MRTTLALALAAGVLILADLTAGLADADKLTAVARVTVTILAPEDVPALRPLSAGLAPAEPPTGSRRSLASTVTLAGPPGEAFSTWTATATGGEVRVGLIGPSGAFEFAPQSGAQPALVIVNYN